MTSNFRLPGGDQYRLFRAEPVADWREQQQRSSGSQRSGVPLEWVPLTTPSLAEPYEVEPPARPAQYPGQIVAVAVAPAVVS